jgi:hypothetical protein
MQGLMSTKAFDCRDLLAFVLDCETQAREDTFAVHQDSAGTARALGTAFLGPGEVKLFAQSVKQRYAWLNLQS